MTLLVSLAPPGSAQPQVQEPDWRMQGERLTTEVRRTGISDSLTLEAIRSVPRHEFVPKEYRLLAYEDIPLPIGRDQTISQPSVVALMTQLVEPGRGRRVLEVGTGSGYQAAVLAWTGCEVWTIEIFQQLASEAAARLRRLGYSSIRVRHGDGYAGWPEEGPFDAILVTAAADSVPPALVEQLAPGGRLVMPVGEIESEQVLVLLEKDKSGRIASRRLLPVRFVPLLRGVR